MSAGSLNDNLLTLTIQKLLNELLTLTGKYIPPNIYQDIQIYQHYFIKNLPYLQYLLYELIDAIFSPNLLCKQLLVALGLQVGVFTLQRIGGIIYQLLSYCTTKGRKLISLQSRMKQSLTYQEWKRLGEQYDALTGFFMFCFSLILKFPPLPLSVSS